jgi:hypothetical protein
MRRDVVFNFNNCIHNFMNMNNDKQFASKKEIASLLVRPEFLEILIYDIKVLKSFELSYSLLIAFK